MAKVILILVLGSMLVLSIFNLTMIENVNQATDVSVDHFKQKQARFNANSMVNMSISKLTDNLNMRIDYANQNFFNGDASVRIVDTNFAGRDLVKISSVGKYYESRSTITAFVKMPNPIPPALEYAINGAQEVTLNGGSPITVGDYLDPTFNANVHSNDKVILNGENITIEGFATYKNSISIGGKNINIIPNSNPNGDPVHYKTSEVSIPNVNLSSILSLATEVKNSDYTLPGGTLELGTKENPKIIYIKGKLFITKNVNVNGYGIIVSEGDVEAKANFIHNSIGTPNYSKVLIATGGKFILDTENATIHASIYAKNEIVINGKNNLIVGNLVSLSKITLNNNGVVVLYHPVSSSVSERVFGAIPVSERLKVVYWYE